MSLYQNFKADANLEKAGIVLQYGENSKGKMMEIRIARAGGANHRFNKVLETKSKPYRRLIQGESLDPKVGEQIMREVYAECVILGWDNIEDEECNDLEFNRENVLKVLKDLPDLFRDIQEQSNKLALFRAAALEDEAKN